MGSVTLVIGRIIPSNVLVLYDPSQKAGLVVDDQDRFSLGVVIGNSIMNRTR